jgi:SAM-dependent methyltransferase
MGRHVVLVDKFRYDALQIHHIRERFTVSPENFDPFVAHPKSFQMFGTIKLQVCPVCGSSDIGLIWQLPQTRFDTHAYLSFASADGTSAAANAAKGKGSYISALPTLKTPQLIYRYDICGKCGSIFRNPTKDDQAVYRRDTSKVENFRKNGAERFRERTNYIARFVSPNAKVILDAACGAGQSLKLLKETFPNSRLVGLEISEPAVAFIKSELKIESYVNDLDADDLDPIVAPGSADFVIFSESFEHVRHPIDVLKKLVRALRPGGRLFYSAQFYGVETTLQIRVNEPIFINTDLRARIPEMIGCRMFEGKLRGDKIQDVLEKL